MKRVLSILLAICLLAAVLPLSASAESSGSCGPSTSWQLRDGILVISGAGPMSDYSLESSAPWAGAGSSITQVVLEEGVTAVGDYAFYRCANLTSVQFADTIRYIGVNAFYHCAGLTSLRLPAGLETLGTAAFSYCSGLTEITQWGALTAISRFAFNECRSLQHVPALPDSLTALGDSAFHHCSALTYLELPKTLTTIGEDAFRASGLTVLTLPSSVTQVGAYAFAECDDLLAIILTRYLLESADPSVFALCDARLIPIGSADPVGPTPPVPDDAMKILYTLELEEGRFLVVSENKVRRELALFAADGSAVANVTVLLTTDGHPNPYPDVADTSWYTSYVSYVTASGLFGGDDAGAFLPQRPMTRAMLATVLYRLAGSPAVAGGDAPFEDVASTSWYAPAVAWARQRGIVNGVDDAHFSPNTDVSRQQMVAMLHRFTLLLGLDSGRRASLVSYGDGQEVSLYALDDMSWAVGEGILVGDNNRLIRPQSPVTRAETATLLTRFLTGIPLDGNVPLHL